ncbi:MAG: hypothetical protein ACQEWM_00900 [Actinomycetota bacterium]
MRRIQPLTITIAAIGVAALAGCASSTPSITPDPAPSMSPAEPGSSASPEESTSPSPSTSAEPSASATQDDDDRATRIADAAQLDAWDPVTVSTAPVVVWGDGFSTVRVFSAGSSSPECQPTGDDVEIEGDRLEIDFDEPEGEGDCPADLAVFGWEFTLPTEGSAAIMTARIDGLADGDGVTVDIEPAG